MKRWTTIGCIVLVVITVYHFYARSHPLSSSLQILWCAPIPRPVSECGFSPPDRPRYTSVSRGTNILGCKDPVGACVPAREVDIGIPIVSPSEEPPSLPELSIGAPLNIKVDWTGIPIPQSARVRFSLWTYSTWKADLVYLFDAPISDHYVWKVSGPLDVPEDLHHYKIVAVLYDSSKSAAVLAGGMSQPFLLQ